MISPDSVEPIVVEYAYGIKAKTVTAENVPVHLREAVQEYLMVLYERERRWRKP